MKYCIFKGLSEEGLFRLPGQAKNVAELKDAFNRGTVLQQLQDIYRLHMSININYC